MTNNLKDMTILERKKATEKRMKTRKLVKNIIKLVEKELPNLTSAKQDKIIKKLQTIPLSWRKRYIDAMKGRSRAKAISYFCGECMGYVAKEECMCETCVLYSYGGNK